ncbi:MAG: Triosephosphate isomerase [Parcubacteria group bacterium GW2011_GWF2_38_8]|nr:MAG: Triosephosphate isomerase [Parcubacteria group bacterium GW2011_GWF2_38_8]
MAKRKIVIGNWKMNPLSLKEAEKLLVQIAKFVSSVKKTEIVVCPPFLYLEKFKSAGWRTKKVTLGAQNAFGRDAGAYTGEISAEMLYNIGARYVILGHSERRAMPVRQSLGIGGGESNKEINGKVKASLAAGLRPILCVGENFRDESHAYFSSVKTQLEECLTGISKNSISKIIIAYEPIWAISSTIDRKDATSADAYEMAIFIRKILSDRFGAEAAHIRVIYGGSVNKKNTEDFLKNGGMDGLLPGRASLNAKEFSEIVKICEALNS